MNKQDLISKIAKDTGQSKTAAGAAVDSLIEGITKSLKKGDSITFVGFGTFSTSQRKARSQKRSKAEASPCCPAVVRPMRQLLSLANASTRPLPA